MSKTDSVRVLTYTGLFPDSTRPTNGIFIYQRMQHFARLPGNSVTVVAPVPYVPRWINGAKARSYRAVPQQEKLDGIVVYHPRYLLFPKVCMTFHGLLMYLGSRRVLRALQHRRFDLIDAHYVYPDGFAAMLAARFLKVPFVVSARGSDINQFADFRTIRPMVRATLRRAGGAIGVCTSLCDAMVELAADRRTMTTIGNGIDVTRFWPVPMSEARRLLKIGDGRVVVSVGSLIPRKRHEATIAAIAVLKRQGLDASLYIVGEGEGLAQLNGQIDRLGLRDRVFLVGAVANEDLRLWYSAANVSCLASSHEGWANVLLESMACGTPVVATRIWGTPEVVVADHLGLLCDLDVPSLAAALATALAHSWDRQRIAAYARLRTWRVVAEEVERFFQSRLRRDNLQPAMDAGKCEYE